jgi:hypothetical protein
MEKIPAMPETTLDAADVLDWNHLCNIAEHVEAPKNWNDGAKRFAYWFTSSGDVAAQNTMLTDLLLNATYKQSPEAAEEVIGAMCTSLGANREKLRGFAKQIGIKLKRS